MSINLGNYETRIFPSTANLANSPVDTFADLTDSFKSNSLDENQVLFAQYFNKLGASVEEIQRWFKFTPATPTSSGDYGDPIYLPECPVSSKSYNASGDGSIASLLPPYIFQRKVITLFSDIYTGIAGTPSGNCLPWEIVITNDTTKNYSNHPSTFLKQEADFWNDYVSGKEVITSAWLSPNTSDIALAPNILPQLMVCHYAIRTDTHFIIRGYIWSQEYTSTLIGTLDSNEINSVLNSIVLNVSILSVAE